VKGGRRRTSGARPTGKRPDGGPRIIRINLAKISGYNPAHSERPCWVGMEGIGLGSESDCLMYE